jgi:hypothetical protein
VRARNIKPGLFKNEILGAADPLLTILFSGLWCMADKAGRLEDRPLRIKAEIFPYRELDINGYLTELSRLGFIHRYEVDNIPYIEIDKFLEHQHPHHTEKESKIPPIPDNCILTVKTPCINRYTPSDSLIPDSLIPDSKTTTTNNGVEDSNNDPPPEKNVVVKLSVSEVQNLMIKYLGKLVLEGGQINLIRDICNLYPPERIISAFEAAGGAGARHLNWVCRWLEAPENRAPPISVDNEFTRMFKASMGGTP